MKKSFTILLFFILSCSDKETLETEEFIFTDKGISIYQDDIPDNDVMMQAFWWDSFSDSRISNSSSYYKFLSNQIITLSNAHIDLVWLPPVSEAEGMGYHPRKLFDFNSLHGSKIELEELLEIIKSRKMHAMADLVFNHRVGTLNWTDFTEPAWSCESICINDEGFTNPDAFGTNYNLGALYFNTAIEQNNKANATSNNSTHKKLKSKADTLFAKALPFLEKAYAIDSKDKNTLLSLKQLYYMKGDYKKSDEMKKIISEL